MDGTSEADLIVVGAGAAGLWAAERAAGGGRRVLLLEKTPRCGTKVLASGGTHCNLTTTLDGGAAARLFGRAGERFLRTAFRTLPPDAVRARFHELGVETVAAPLEKIFPASGRARDVRDALERSARERGVVIRCGAGVRAIEPAGGGRGATGWTVVLEDDTRRKASGLVLAPGGRSYARTGTTGDGYAWLAALDLPVVEPVPALVPLTSPAAWVHELSGVSLQDVGVRLVAADGTVLGRRERPIVFTHQGVSGPGAMDLSEPVARAVASAGRPSDGPSEEVTVALALELDLLPTIDREALSQRLVEVAGRKGAPLLLRALELGLPRRVGRAALAQAGYETEPRANGLGRAGRHRFVEALKGLVVPVDGTRGFEHAEVTAGGLALSAVDAGTLRVNGWSNLWVCGELLDLAGPIGGLNFQAAFATAELVGRDAARAS